MRKQLAQNSPAAATDVELYAPPASQAARNFVLYVCETGGATATFDVYHDDSGAVRTAATALFFQVALAANESRRIQLDIDMTDDTNGLGVEASTADVNFTLYGQEYLP